MKNTVVLLAFLSVLGCSRVEIDQVLEEQSKNERKITVQTDGSELVTLANGMRVLKKGDGYLFQGDIVLTEAQINQLENPELSKGGYLSDWNRRWSNQRVYYVFDALLAQDERDCMISAMNHIAERTNIFFIPRTNESNYIKFIRDTGNYSALGCVDNGQIIGLFNTRTMGIVACHALGMIHEQSRSDRDNYVEIIWRNIQDGKAHNFDIVPETENVEPFNFSSIMMYDPTAFSIDGVLLLL